MATSLPTRPRILRRVSSCYAIVESTYNEQYVRPMADSAAKEIQIIEPSAEVDRVIAPGAFEIPLIAKTLLPRKKYRALIALGVILRGETAHADLIARAVTDALMQLALESGIPVIHEVLLLDHEEQAQKRCLGQELNRGIEAARAAIQAARIIKEISPLPR